ncbi:hypothetical protein HC028_13645 [Planosporangium flavigriseum]|uniref:Uncharacterized protein n=1 Tax=Planosporangium flavigriseum TaxID=373681 RepID=A0A8J3LWC8_9ACTN|nr:hypothetical protein [Planosporangium flavigriseum]NJC65539.1 hypothetical protein [Planosporangium flavigriseum]GIG75024.1 hypothetical protein Pfl04_34280 [Planosporangium flavigriseum]
MLSHPLVVLAAAILLPGSGQVINRTPVRGLVFVFYMLLLGAITYRLTTEHHSFLGRFSGGLFVYAISVLDAYRHAAHRASRGASEVDQARR